MNVTAPEALISLFATAALEPHVIPSPARSASVAAVVAPLRRERQRLFDTVGLPRGLRVAA